MGARSVWLHFESPDARSHCSGVRDQGLIWDITFIAENQMQKNMDNEMKSGVSTGVLLVRS